jgi:5-methylcytosine-specific restriction endonuclease McrBC GTP-binding regulatory subunit McrB
MQVCQDLLNQYDAEGDSFLDCIITGDELWYHNYELESKQQSMEWQHVYSPSKKKFKTLPSAGKVTSTFFWDRKGVIFLDFLEPVQTINSDCYIMMLTKMKDQLFRVRPEKKTTFLLQHDNARHHTSLKTVEHISVLAGLSHCTHRIVQIWRLLTSICSGR